MNVGAWDTRRAAFPNQNGKRLFAGLLTIGFAGTVAAAMAGNGSVPAAVAPTLVVVGLVVMWIAPIRLTLFALLFLVLLVDAPGDAAGMWTSPNAWIGTLLKYNLNRTIPWDPLALPLMAVVILSLFVVHVHRWLAASRIDDRRDIATARPMLWALGISSLTVVALCVEGYLRGGDTQMSKNQVQTFLLLLLMAYLFMMTLRGVRDYRTLGRLILIAACMKAATAVFVWYTVEQELPFRTSHGDSILFASATIMLIVLFVEQPIKRNAQLCVAILPLIFAGILANNRRLAWVEVSASLMVLALISPRTRFKAAVSRALLLAMPIIALYGAAGWNSEARFFAPARTLRSISDADVDRSTLYRDIEDYNLLQTLRQNPIIGMGFGQPYLEVVPHDDISGFKEYRYLPHNSILGLWATGGLLGFTGFSAALVVGVFLAARGYFRAAAPVERAAAFSALAAILVYLIHCWGDIGLVEHRSIFLTGPALAIAGQVGLTTGLGRGRPEPRRLS